MSNKPIAESVRQMAKRAVKPTTAEGRVVKLQPIDNTIFVQIKAGSTATPVRVPVHIGFEGLSVGVTVTVSMASDPPLLLGVISAPTKIAKSVQNERDLNSLLQRLEILEAQVATLLADRETGGVASRLRESLLTTLNQGAAGITQEVKR